ncbi:MAG: PH domain-containing protein [Methanomicrobiaceae archaeon]|nr:PH domain-containing protein [Methanomicrobiaceae archaeon]
MWEIAPHLQKDEIIELSGSPVWAGYWGLFLLALLFIWTIIIPILIVGYIVLHKESTKFVVTNKRVAARMGIISERFKSSTFKHITSIKVRQGLMLSFVGDQYQTQLVKKFD